VRCRGPFLPEEATILVSLIALPLRRVFEPALLRCRSPELKELEIAASLPPCTSPRESLTAPPLAVGSGGRLVQPLVAQKWLNRIESPEIRSDPPPSRVS
jgi:hypothetical protein